MMCHQEYQLLFEWVFLYNHLYLLSQGKGDHVHLHLCFYTWSFEVTINIHVVNLYK